MTCTRAFSALIITATMTACSSVTKFGSGIQNTPAPRPITTTPKTIRPNSPTDSQPVIHAESALVIDALTGRILYQKNPRSKRAVASTQKLLTAFIVSSSGPLSDLVMVQKSDTLVEPTKLDLKPGETYTRRDLVKALLVKSGNDVAMALGRDVAGSKREFAALMNATAKSLGMSQSNFLNPHGLTEPGQYSTALDIAIIARRCYHDPFLRQCMQTKSYLFAYPDGRTRILTNTNKVLSRLAYCNGMKTGYTRAAGRCLVSSATLNGRAVIAVLLGTDTAHVWDDSAAILRWALEG